MRRFARATDGGVTVEFVLWLPVFLAVLMLATDASLLFLRQSNFWSAARETARIVARHGMEPGAAEDHAARRAAFGTLTPEARVRIDPATATVTVRLSAPARRMAPFGILGFALGQTISAEVTDTLEPF